MKKGLLLLGVMVCGQVGAVGRLSELNKRSAVRQVAGSAASNTIRGVGAAVGMPLRSARNVVDAVTSPIKTAKDGYNLVAHPQETGREVAKSYRATRDSSPGTTSNRLVNIVSPFARVGEKISNMYKSVRYSNSEKAAQREVDKITKKLDKNKKIESDQNDFNLALSYAGLTPKGELKNPKNYYSIVEKPITEEVTGRYNQSPQEQLNQARLKAAKSVGDNTKLVTRIFNRGAYKKAMKEAILKADVSYRSGSPSTLSTSSKPE